MTSWHSEGMFHEPLSQIFTTAELRANGLSPRVIRNRSQKGTLTKILHGVYADPGLMQRCAQDPRLRALTMHAAVIKTNPSAVLSHQSAALWHGAPLLKLPTKVHVSTPAGQNHTNTHLTVHRNRTNECVTAQSVSGFMVTTPAQTILDCALTMPPPEALCVTNYFLNTGACALEQVHEVLKAPGRRGRTNAHQVATRMSTLCESPLETAAWDLFMTRNLELPTQQLWVSEDHRADFAWKSLRLILEADGEVKYSGQYGAAGHVIQNERRRQRALEKAGWTVMRTDWKEVIHTPDLLVARLKAFGVKAR